MGSRYTDILPNGHKVIFGFIVNAHQRAASAEKDLNNQVDRISCLNFSLSPSTSVLAQRADEKDITVADGVCAQTHHNWPGAHYCWMTTLLMVECPHCDPLRWHHSSGGTSQIPGGRWFALDYFHNQEDNTLFLKKLLALGMYLLSLPALFLPKLLIDFQNALIMSWYFVSHCFWPGSWFYSKWNVALGSCSRNPWSYHIPHYLKAAEWIEQWVVLLKTLYLLVAVLCSADVMFSEMGSRLWISHRCVVGFLL